MAVGLLCGVSLGGASGDGREFHEMVPSAILSIHAIEEDLCRVKLSAMASAPSSLQVVSSASCESLMHGNAQSLSRLWRHGVQNSDCLLVTWVGLHHRWRRCKRWWLGPEPVLWCRRRVIVSLGENLISNVFGRVFLKIHIQFLREPIILAWLTSAMISDTFWAFWEEIFLEKKASQT